MRERNSLIKRLPFIRLKNLDLIEEEIYLIMELGQERSNPQYERILGFVGKA